MNTPPGDGAALARVLAGALSLGLPCPDSITISPHVMVVSAIDFQFNASYGQDPVPALNAWAARFGATVDVEADSKDPASTWHELNFTHDGVMFRAYAKVSGTAAPAPGDCAGCGHPRASHWEDSEPDGPRKGCSRLGCPCTAYDPGDGEPLSGGPVTTRGDLDEAYEAAPKPLVISDSTIAQARYLAEHPSDADCAAGTCPACSALRIAPGGSAGPASLASVQVQPSGFVTADAPVLRGARIGGGQ